MWVLLFFLGVFLHQGGLAQLWPPPRTEGQADTPQAVRVTCEPHRVVVSAHRDLFGVGRLVAPADLALGVARCRPAAFDPVANQVVFEAGLHECGSTVQMTPDLLIYRTSLFYTPSLAHNPIITRTNAAEIPIECHYPRKGNLTSRAIRPTWAPFRSTISAEARLRFSLRLMKDDWSAERTSIHFQLGETLRLQANVRSENHVPLRLFVDSCLAGSSPEGISAAQYAIVDSHGCLVDGRQDSVSSAFLSPRTQEESLRFTVDAFRFSGDPTNLIYITCRLKVTPTEQAPDEVNKACSYSAETNSWVPVEGARGICLCCKSQSCGRALRLQSHRLNPRFEMSWQRSLPVGTDAGHARLVLGPILVSDAHEGVPAEEEEEDGGDDDNEMVLEEEFLPVVETKTEGTGTRIPFEEKKGTTNISEEEVKPELPWEAYVRGGPIVHSGEDGSGFGEQVKAVVTEESTALEFKAEVVSRTLEDDLSSRTLGKVPSEGVNLAAKGLKQPPGGVMLLSVSILLAGAGVTLLVLGAFVFSRRSRCHSNSARHSSTFDTGL
nr:PREDICTED: zona pellucida sperm-binding protein 3 isoform X1 [Anolis carolinensis]|eukprot:XP_016854341.1 PREDICTED: zona pellucida sperm-binding protein 3 isoform X1 [Anolis carolinensis]